MERILDVAAYVVEYFNKAMCKDLAKAEKGIEMGRVIVKTMEELEAME